MILHRRQLPCPKALFLSKLAAYNAAMIAHAATVGIPAPFPDYDVFRGLDADLQIVQEVILGAAVLSADGTRVRLTLQNAQNYTLVAADDPYMWELYQEWLLGGGVATPFQAPIPPTAKEVITAQIVSLEVQQLAPRFSREYDLGSAAQLYVLLHPGTTLPQALANLVNPQHPDYNIGLAKLKAFDDSIVALRAKLAAIP